MEKQTDMFKIEQERDNLGDLNNFGENTNKSLKSEFCHFILNK